MYELYELYTVRCRYNGVQYVMILHTALQWQQQNADQIFNSEKTPMACPWGTAPYVCMYVYIYIYVFVCVLQNV